ncbi:MAG TPA: NifU family protein [Streptosporangiaceae bacterium]|nr:NifU family protein [Streptosporangiaceae bacterium]
MSDLAAEVTAALGRSILPSVIARGATGLRVVTAEDGVVTLAADGSPGAVLPILGRIEAQLRAAVPGVTAVRLAAAGPQPEAGDLAEAARTILDAEINPAIAAHRGRVTVAGVAGGWIRVRLEGGCQGCSLAEVTLRQGIEPVLRARLPAMTGLVDVTEHEAGTEPFFSPAKR